MKAKAVVVAVLKGIGVITAYQVLFLIGADAFVPPGLTATPGQPPDDPTQALVAVLAIAVLDSAILAGIALTSSLRGWRLWLLLSAFFYFVKTFTSQLEAIYFMPNVYADMVPWLMAMTLPLCVFFPAVLMVALGCWKSDPTLAPALPRLERQELLLKVGSCAALIYPLLFFFAGYWIAWQSAEVRAFYTGSVDKLGMWQHLSQLFTSDPTVYPFEVFRGLLWTVAALVVLRTSTASAVVSTLLVGLSFCFIQNDMHLLSNPLMPEAVRLAHFIETGSSNFVFALCAGWLLTRSHTRDGRLESAVALVS